MLSAAQLNKIMPNADAALWLDHLNCAMTAQEINGPMRLAAFLAHVAVESGELRIVVENMNYSVERLMAVWPARFPTAEVAAPFAHDPEKLGNFAYANRLGNGPPNSGDGFRYRGRGLLQATGKDHYREAGAALGVNFLATPELLEKPELAAKEAAWWWRKRGLNAIADAAQFRKSTIVINGGLTGYSDRVAYWRRALAVLGANANVADTSELILDVQKALNAHGAQPKLKEDGIWGPMSEAALDHFRIQAGLPESDEIDDAVLTALKVKKAA
ncbi:MAG TPA: glycoside hydrolase family 19 protein [Bradyrhizobium sp.]|nr:glycoside hydrolase family 19 protein [Bradyrhizobium sp.]